MNGIANAITERKEHDEIVVTQEMIKAVLAVLHDYALPSVARLAESPELAEALCRAVITANRSLLVASLGIRQ